MDLKTEIERLVNQLLTADAQGETLFLVDVHVAGNPNFHPKVTVLLDGDAGITIDKCAEISRRLGNQLETLDLINSAFVLEVSSPGLDTPLLLRRQYVKNLGRKVKVSLNDGSTKTGTLLAVNEEGILLEEERAGKRKAPAKSAVPGAPPPQETHVRIAWSGIQRTFVLVSF